jgi:hypothetical protein
VVLGDLENDLAFDACMTPFSCSKDYYKVETSVGEFCVPSTELKSSEFTDNILSAINFLANAFDQ